MLINRLIIRPLSYLLIRLTYLQSITSITCWISRCLFSLAKIVRRFAPTLTFIVIRKINLASTNLCPISTTNCHWIVPISRRSSCTAIIISVNWIKNSSISCVLWFNRIINNLILLQSETWLTWIGCNSCTCSYLFLIIQLRSLSLINILCSQCLS